MIIDCISDLHGFVPVLQGGDLLIVAGDCTARNQTKEWKQFFDWFKSQDYKKKILVAGNHDGFLVDCISSKVAEEMGIREDWDYDYLMDSGIEFEGLKIWGSPWTPKFFNWYFMKKRGPEIEEKWELIPEDTNILITHGPPYGKLDKNDDGIHCGCVDLQNAVNFMDNLKLHVFGHIHEGYGREYQAEYTPGDARDVLKPDYTGMVPIGHLSVNASIMNRFYRPVNAVMRVIL